MKGYSKELAEVVQLWLDSNDYTYDFDEEYGAFMFGVRLPGKINEIICSIYTGHHSYSIEVELENLVFDDEKTQAVSEYLHRVNSIYHFSRLELDWEEKRVFCSQCLNCIGTTPSQELLEENLMEIYFHITKCSSGMIEVIEGVGTPKEICEKYKEEILS